MLVYVTLLELGLPFFLEKSTTIQFGQSVIYDEDGNKYQYRYPRTILADIQRRPNLPPAEPGEVLPEPCHIGVYFLAMRMKNDKN